MNLLERWVYNKVRSNSVLKERLRDFYQSCFDYVPMRRDVSAYPIDEREGFFFGFHDKCPWSADNTLLLAHRVLIPLRAPRWDDPVEVGYFSGPGYRIYQPLAQTTAWNWHQGAMLQWLGSSSNLLFNVYDGKQHCAHIVDLKGERLSMIPCPIAALSRDGRYGLSYSFARLRRSLYEYAYANGEDRSEDVNTPPDDGLYLVDVERATSTLMFPIAELAQYDAEPSMRRAFHYFTHCQFSPSGSKFVFFHRWTQDGYRRWTRMILANLSGKILSVFPTSGMVSHVAWRDDNHILAYASVKGMGDAYYLFTCDSQRFTPIGSSVLTADGHPSFSHDGRWIVTDTYPDRYRRRNLILFQVEQQVRYNLARLYSPKQYVDRYPGENIRCDLHPRWNRDSTMICFDSAHTGQRSLCTINIGNLSDMEPASV